MTEAEESLLVALWDPARGTTRHTPAEQLEARLADELPEREVHIGSVLAALGASGWIREHEGQWSLTLRGEQQARTLAPLVGARSFGRWLVNSAGSEAYAEWCRQVYGADRIQFNLCDDAQLHSLVRLSGLTPGQHFVDLGCGLGTLTAWIAEQTGATGVGLDFAEPAISWAQQNLPGRYVVGDVQAPHFPPHHFDAAFAIDSLYFVKDLSQTVPRLLTLLRPGARLVATFSAHRTVADAEDLATVTGNRLGRALNGLDYEYIDVTEQTLALWRLKRRVTDALREAFVAEGNLALFTSRDSEVARILPLFEQGLSRRYLYSVRAHG